MKLLLDTHIWLWAVGAPQKLSRRVTSVLRKNASEVWLSPVSIWELHTLTKKGRINLRKDIGEWIANAFVLLPVREAPLTNAVALEVTKLRLPHDDPADAFLAATANVFELTLVTGDEKLLATKHISTLAND